MPIGNLFKSFGNVFKPRHTADVAAYNVKQQLALAEEAEKMQGFQGVNRASAKQNPYPGFSPERSFQPLSQNEFYPQTAQAPAQGIDSEKIFAEFMAIKEQRKAEQKRKLVQQQLVSEVYQKILSICAESPELLPEIKQAIKLVEKL